MTSVATQTETYNVSTLFTGDGFTATTALPGFTVTPTVFALGFGQSQVVSVTVTSNDSQGIGENQGYIVLDGTAHDAHMPVWARVTPATQTADVLLIDNDASDLDPSFGDYLPVYTSTLDALGLTYDIVNTAASFGEATTIPDAAHLAGYGAVVWYTGDNYVTVAGLTNQDQYNLLDYLTNGGKVIAMGQDLASTVDAAPGSQYNGLYNFGLGATWVQDSISAYEIPTGYATRAPSAPRLFSNVVVSLTQIYIDEIKPDISDNPYVVRGGVPVLNYGGPFNVLNGTVAMLHRDQPVLEGPVIPYLGRSFYTTFGLEGIGEVATDVLTTTTGLELMSDALAWASSEPGTGTITDITPITTTAITIFSAGYTATVPAGYAEWLAEPVSYRWDFGDGSGFVATGVNEAGHTYVCQAEGSNTYTVRVEIIDGFGNGTVVSQDVDVSKSCNTEPVTIQKYFIPWVGKDFKE